MRSVRSAHHRPRLGEESWKRWFSKRGITESKGQYPKTPQAAQEQQERTGEALPQPCGQADVCQQWLLQHLSSAVPVPTRCPNCQGGARAATARLGLPSPCPRKHPAEVHTLLRPRGCVPCARALCGAKQSHRSLQRRGVNTNSSVFSVKQQTEPRHLSPEPGTSYDQQPGPGSPASPSHCNQPSPKIINSRLFLHLLSRKTALISCFVRLYHASTILA